MTKFLDPSFSSRPASQEYRDNYDRTFGQPTSETPPDGTTPAPEGRIYVCGACGKTSKTRYGFDADGVPCAEEGWDSSCASQAVLCYDTKIGRRKWIAVASVG